MMKGFKALALVMSVLVSGCATISAATRARQEADSAEAVTALQGADFDQATRLAEEAIGRDDTNARAHAVEALARFVSLNHTLVSDVMTLGASVMLSAALRSNFLDLELFDSAFNKADARLVEVDRHLGAAEKDPGVSLELCLACWSVDWNRNGTIDESDRHLFEVETNADGSKREPDDARRRPTFRFDVADVHWLHALASFERAGLELARAWNFAQVVKVVIGGRKVEALRLPLRSAERARRAQALLLQALAESRECRQLALAEVDDDREWVPNPLQRSHPIPLPVDVALYDTWNTVLTDLEGLLRSQQGLDLGELATLEAQHSGREPIDLHGFIDLGRLLSMPEDLTLEFRHGREGISPMVHTFFGKALVEAMPRSALPEHLERMQREIADHEETFEQKLRYLFWLN